jgi:hypothetical protein
MTTIEGAGRITGSGVGILDRERTIAAAGYCHRRRCASICA